MPPAAVEHVVDLLARHFARDHLTETELESRLERVYAATSLAELEAAVGGLPDIAETGRASVATAARPTRVAALFSGHERKVTGVVPRALDVRARLGYVELDLTRATFEPGETVIDVRTFMGYAHIRLPVGVRVESDGRALFGFFALKGAANPDDSARVVRITGRAIFGFAECFTGGERTPAGDA